MPTVRQTIIDTIRTQLTAITLANGYSRDVGEERVFGIKDAPTGIPMPAILIMQGNETTPHQDSDRYHCFLELAVGFVDNWAGTSPDHEALSFMADIQKAIQIESSITVLYYPSGNPGLHMIQVIEQGNSINVTDAIPGIIMGQVTYEVRYDRNVYDPNML